MMRSEMELTMADNDRNDDLNNDDPSNVDRNSDLTVVPLPSSETEAEHRRVRSSNDRDQKLEREGKRSRHNEGYDEAADGKAPSKVENVIDED